MSFTPNTRLSVTPQVLIPVGSPGAQTSVGTAIQANVVGNLALVTDVGVAGTADTAWAPLASARLVGQWPRAGIETSVLRGAAAPRTETDTAFVSSRDREAARAQVQPLPGLTLVALTSSSRPAADPDADDTTLGSLRIAYDGLPTGQAGHGSAAGDDGLAGVGNHLARMAPARAGPHGRALRAATGIRLGARMGSTRPRLASKWTFPRSRPAARAAWTCAPRSRQAPAR